MLNAANVSQSWIVDLIADFIFEGCGCGLCQVGVPCEAGIPVRRAREALARGELPPSPPPLA